jgi:hypothetical protein
VGLLLTDFLQLSWEAIPGKVGTYELDEEEQRGSARDYWLEATFLFTVGQWT